MDIRNDFFKLSKDITKIPLSHLWDGFEGTVFLEFGELTKSLLSDGTEGNPKGQITIGIEWSWAFFDKNASICTSEDKEDIWVPVLKDLIESNIAALNLIGAPPEIELIFDNGRRLLSLADEEGNPSWMIIDNRSPTAKGFEVKNGMLLNSLTEFT